MEVILWLHWFNPAAWLLKRELKDIHEYQADKGVLAQGIDATKYQLLLVKKAVGSSLYTLANSFNHSKIKKRITMMLKGKSNNWARLKLLLLVPVGLIVLNAFARPEVNRQLETLIQSKDKDTPPEEQQDLKEFFKTELCKYVNDTAVMASADKTAAFLKKNTNVYELFMNANSVILLKFDKILSVEELPAVLQERFASEKKNGKPVSFYFKQDINTPKEKVERALEIVKEAFLQQQATVGTDKAPFLLFEDGAHHMLYSTEKKKIQLPSDNKSVLPPSSPDGTI